MLGAPSSMLRESAGCPGAACAGTRSDRQRSEHGRSGSGGRPAPSKKAPTIAVSRSQALNEDLSDCAEACPSVGQPVFAVTPGPQWGRAYGNRQAGVAQPTGGRCTGRQAGGSSEGTRIEIKRPGARLRAVGVCAIASVAEALEAHRRSAEGPALIDPEPVAVQPCRILVRAPSHSTHE